NSTTILTDALPAGTVTTTIQAARHADLEESDVFSDAEIEKAIDEIRGAIEKSNRITQKT
ncbi:MAG: serine/threonine-protein phosphatase, partial [Telluria sp.]|nr:serine/threonine-protein phosphatase [Telluria sp.]